MKKLVCVFSSLLLFLVLLTGCGKNDCLQTTPTNYDMMDFYYHNYLEAYENEYQKASANFSKLTTRNAIDDKNRVRNLFNYSQKIFEQEVCVIACLDYFESVQNETTEKLPLYEFSANSKNYEISINKSGNAWIVELSEDGVEKLSLTLTLLKIDEGSFSASYNYNSKISKMSVTFEKDRGLLTTSLTTKTSLDLDSSEYQDVIAEKNIYGLYSNIRYFDAFYDVKNSMGVLNGGLFSIECSSANVFGKLKFAKCDTKNAAYDITALKQSDLASALTNNQYSLIFEKNEEDQDNQYSWKQYGDIGTWNNLVG